MHRWGGTLTGFRGRQVPARKLHITLAFLGSLNDAEESAARALAGQIANARFGLALNTLGHWRKPQVIWLAPALIPQALQTLESTLRTGLQQAGMALDPRPYQPHLTLFRKVNQLPRDLPAPDFDWPISDFRLVESIAHAEGVRYQALQSWPLNG